MYVVLLLNDPPEYGISLSIRRRIKRGTAVLRMSLDTNFWTPRRKHGAYSEVFMVLLVLRSRVDATMTRVCHEYAMSYSSILLQWLAIRVRTKCFAHASKRRSKKRQAFGEQFLATRRAFTRHDVQ